MKKTDLIAIIMGMPPSSSQLNETLVKNAGTYVGGFKDEWRWDRNKLINYTSDELYNLYKILS